MGEIEVQPSIASSSNLGKKLGISMVDIYVGPSKEQFHVHKDLLCAKVPYFEKMFLGGFKEAEEQAANLENDDPGAFGLLLEWLYGGRFQEIDITRNKRHPGPLMDRIQLYGLAEKLVLPNLMDYTATSILSGYKNLEEFPSTEAISSLYRCTTSRAPMRAYMAKQLHRIVNRVEEHMETTHSTANISQSMLESEDLTHDLISRMRGRPDTPANPTGESKCTYHIHSKDHDCRFKETIRE